MSRFSIFNFLSIILPGSILMFLLMIVFKDYGTEIDVLDVNQYFVTIIFLSASIFFGSLLNIMTREFLNFLKKFGLHTSIYKIYCDSISLRQIKPFLENRIKEIFKQEVSNDSIELLWDEAFYELEASNKINSSKSYQSYYFFFRNFFALGVLLLLPLLILSIYCWQSPKHLFFLVVNVFGILSSMYAGNWYRKKMVERIFWTYYSINKNKNK